MAKKVNSKGSIVAALAAALLMSGGALVRTFTSEKTKELAPAAYSIGAMTEDGAIDKESKSSLYTAKYDPEDLVSVEIKEDAKVTVKIYLYSDQGFDTAYTINPEEGLDRSLITTGTTGVRIVIEPTDDDDGEINFFEKAEYANLVTVTLNK